MSVETKPLLSRVADSLYWMARYMERAENVARLLEVNLHLQLDLPLDGNQWQPVIDTCGEAPAFRKKYGEATQESVIAFLAQDRDYANSITSCLFAARENARSVRETISSEMWEHVNGVYLKTLQQYAKPPEELSPEVFRDLRLNGHMFQGITDATMSHNEPWHFVRLGRQMERADKTSRLLDVKYFMLLPRDAGVGTPYDDLLWSAVLKSVSGFEMYRQSRGKVSPREVVSFLVLDPDFPRSIRHSIARAVDSLDVIRGGVESQSARQLGELRRELDEMDVDQMILSGLHEFLDNLQLRLNAVGAGLQRDFFALRTQMQSQTQAVGGD
ncbi:MAG: alpha-E domain-containing protein [Bryobacterales bacterium]|nr:alpha-E domain-containing protein [Bryobacterales bacterium]